MNLKAVKLTLDLYMVTKHPQKVMKELGITYGLAVPQPIADCWQFYMCENLPLTLPEYLIEDNKINPFNSVGFGLSEEDAIKIDTWKKEYNL